LENQKTALVAECAERSRRKRRMDHASSNGKEGPDTGPNNVERYWVKGQVAETKASKPI